MSDTESLSPGNFASTVHVANGSPDLLQPSHKERATKNYYAGAETRCLCPNSLSELGFSNAESIGNLHFPVFCGGLSGLM